MKRTMKIRMAHFLFLNLLITGCTPDRKAESSQESNKLTAPHDISRIVCSIGGFSQHHIEIQSDGHVIYKGMNDFYKTNDHYNIQALYVGRIDEEKFNEIAERLVKLNYLELNDYESTADMPGTCFYMEAHIYHGDTVKVLLTYNEALTKLLTEILELRGQARLKLIDKHTHKLFETEIPPPQVSESRDIIQ